MRHLFTLLVVLLAFATMSFGQKAGWHKIGEVQDFKTDMDGITLAEPQTFQSIKIKITDARMDIMKVVIYYHNNKAEEIRLVGKVKEGEAKIFQLKYPHENLRKVVLMHRSDPDYEADKADVELYGFKG
jgi:hypothetical protein